MPVETITIINNAGKIISTGRHLASLFDEAKAAYREKKDAIKLDRAIIQRDGVHDAPPSALRDAHDDVYTPHGHGRLDADRAYDGRRMLDKERSRVSSRQSHSSPSHARPRAPLTKSNLRSHSEVSTQVSTQVSPTSRTYQSPCGGFMADDGARLSRPPLVHASSMPVTRSATRRHAPTMVAPPSETAATVPRQNMLVQHRRSTPSLRRKKEVDMDLAYGSMPPDLASRVDLDPDYEGSAQQREDEARKLMGRVETLLTEAQCLHHTAAATMAHLQRNPEAAAAVALTLAELSTLLRTMSPAFLGVVKGGSPSVFALLASPQFLMGTSIAIGVTVVMFGGWKIVKRIRDAAHRNKEAPMAAMAPMAPMAARPQAYTYTYTNTYTHAEPVYGSEPTETSASYDEALVLEEELGSIESWRRGIVPMNEDDMADVELMSLEAERTLLERHGPRRRSRSSRRDDDIDPNDSASQAIPSPRTRKKHNGHRSSSSSSKLAGGEPAVSERKSSRSAKGTSNVTSSDRGSHRSHTSRSKRSERVSVHTIEDASRHAEHTLEMVLRPKTKKPNMLKALFKKSKDSDDGGRTAVSVMV